ncbi:MAG TPA: glycosyltransferase family 4 protein [Gammaproteobacteria bacterium]|nr:glycosyltransferase family 4 protein [Gammaproteobacteria bacterium]
MKILYHHRIGSRDDGQLVHIQELVAALERRGHDVLVIGPSVTDTSKASGARIAFIVWLKKWLPKAVYETLEFFYSFGDYLRLSRAIKAFAPDLIYERYNLFWPSGIWARRRFAIPLILEVNAPLYAERSRYGGLALKPLARWTERACWRGADRVVTVTEVLRRQIEADGVPRHRISVTPNGVNFDRFPDAIDRDAAKRRLKLENKLVLGFVGYAREWHGLDRVLDVMAANRQRNLFFLLVGGGSALPSLRRLAARMNLEDRVRFVDFVEHEKVVEYLHAFDIALQPAVVDYASPLKLLEYMACRTAIVAPDKENIREILTHEQNALLFQPNDLAGFAAAIDRFCRDPALRERLGGAARNTLTERDVTWSHNAAVVETIACAIMKPERQERRRAIEKKARGQGIQ